MRHRAKWFNAKLGLAAIASRRITQNSGIKEAVDFGSMENGR
jgi:hypothetical protein